METRRRFRPSVKWLALGLVLCLALIGGVTAVFAAGGPRIHPHITVTPHTIYTDINGCGSVRISGSGFEPSTQSITAFAGLEVTDSENGAYFQTPFIFPSVTIIPVDARGHVSASETICDSFLVPGDTFTICATTVSTVLFPIIDGNCVNIRAS